MIAAYFSVLRYMSLVATLQVGSCTLVANMLAGVGWVSIRVRMRISVGIRVRVRVRVRVRFMVKVSVSVSV